MPADARPFQNKIKTLLAAGKAVWGAGLPDASDLVAKFTISTGVDFLWIDTEHRPYDAQEVRWIPYLCRRAGCEAVMRVPNLDVGLIKKALDIGASTIMVPQIATADDARKAVEFCKYAPEGRRGVSPLWTIFADVPWDDYLPAANEETGVIVQIETPEAIENFEEICAVPGVDVVFAGPVDLSAALGHIGQLDHPKVRDYLADFPRRAADCGKPAGITVVGLEASRRVYDQGYRFIVIGNLVSQGSIALSADLRALREHDQQ